MKKKLLNVLLLLAVFTLSSCSAKGTDTNEEGTETQEKTQISMLGTIKTEIDSEFREAVKDYNESQNKYELNIIDLDGNPFEKMTALYASGNAPTILVTGQEGAALKDNLLDLSEVPLLEYAQKGTYDLVTDGEKVYGFPITVEAYGILYNKDLVEKVMGPDFDYKSINSKKALEDLYTKIEASGVDSVHVSPMDWSLGAHLSNLTFAPQSEDPKEVAKFINDLIAGDIKLIENESFNNWMDTLDMLLEHNTTKDSPLSPTYDDGSLMMADGKVATWFQGNWALPSIQKLSPEINLGMLPYPISDDPNDYGNTQISVGVPLYFSVDAKQSTKEEQEGAIDFITWLFTSEVGQKHYVEEMKLIPIYTNVTTTPKDTLSNMIYNYLNDGKTLPWINMQYPPDASASMGATLQKYLVKEIDRNGVAKEFEDYWKGQSK